jgi:hypothetical protein
VPTFCRHNRFLQNCPICSKDVQTVTPAGPPEPVRRAAASTTRRPSPRARSGVKVRRLVRGPDDGYHHRLVPGLRSSEDARRLAEALAFASARLDVLATDPPGLYAEVAAQPDVEEALWLCFLIAYLGPAETDDPFAGIRAAHVTWSSGEAPRLDGVEPGPRGAHDPARGTATVDAYRAFAARAGSQAAALGGDASWPAQRRFARVFERLAFPGFHRAARFELLDTAAALGRLEARADALHVGGEDDVTLAAKRIFGIGDTLLLEQRARALAEGVGLPLEALDLGLFNWFRVGERATGGTPEATGDPQPIAAALGL